MTARSLSLRFRSRCREWPVGRGHGEVRSTGTARVARASLASSLDVDLRLAFHSSRTTAPLCFLFSFQCTKNKHTAPPAPLRAPASPPPALSTTTHPGQPHTRHTVHRSLLHEMCVVCVGPMLRQSETPTHNSSLWLQHYHSRSSPRAGSTRARPPH